MSGGVREVAGLVTAGTRVALNLSGVEVSDVPRGSWVCTPGSMPDSRVIDVRYQHLADAPEMEGEPRVLVLLGTREGVARLVPLEGEVLRPGSSVLAQLRFAVPFPCLAGDHFVIRRESPARTLGGGQVLDPFATVVRKAQAGDAAVSGRWNRFDHAGEARDRNVRTLTGSCEFALLPKPWSRGHRLVDR